MGRSIFVVYRRICHSFLVSYSLSSEKGKLMSSIYMPNPIYHEITFASLLFTCVGRTIVLIRRLPKDHWSKSAVKRTFGWGVGTFAAAFVIWNIDNICCDQLRKARGLLGFWGFILEGESVFALQGRIKSLTRRTRILALWYGIRIILDLLRGVVYVQGK